MDKKDFLNELAQERWKEQYIKIDILNFSNEDLILSIEGYATGGNLNLNGSSYIRRTATLSLLAAKVISNGIEYFNYNLTDVNNLISLSKKIRIQVGFLNTLKNKYADQFATDDNSPLDADIIWIPQGVFIIKQATASENTQGINISLTLTDKSAMLNGEVGGVYPAHTIFSETDVIDMNRIFHTSEKKTIKQILQEIVTSWGSENDWAGGIYVNIPEPIERVVRWTGTDPVYRYIEMGGDNKNIVYKMMTDPESDDAPSTNYSTFYNGQDIGYSIEPFYYPGTLECNAGETAAAVIDKIKNTLGGNYEWYYDIEGKFHFQPINLYSNDNIEDGKALTVESLSSALGDIPQSSAAFLSNINHELPIVHSFTDKSLVASINQTPQYMNIKNEYMIWGSKKTANGGNVAIRYHLRFDEKPDVIYSNGSSFGYAVYVDALGLTRIINLTSNNCERSEDTDSPTPPTDTRLLWLVKDNNDDTKAMLYQYSLKHKNWIQTSYQYYNDLTVNAGDWRAVLYLNAINNDTSIEPEYRAELISEMPKLYAVQDGDLAFRSDLLTDNITYWLDYLGSEEADPLYPYRIGNIGRRMQVVNDTNVNCIFTTEIPKIAFVHADGDIEDYEIPTSQYAYVQLAPEVYRYISTGGSQNSAFEKVVELLTTHTQYNDSINISTIPMFHLEPNQRINFSIDNDKQDSLNVEGDYIIKTISIPLAINGMMNITASRAIVNKIDNNEI